MSLNDWSERIVIAELGDEPAFSEDMDALAARFDGCSAAAPGGESAGGAGGDASDVVLDFRRVTHLNSSNLAQLLRLRKRVAERGRRLRLCCINDSVWSVLLTTGLDGVFTFNEDIATALAGLQMA